MTGTHVRSLPQPCGPSRRRDRGSLVVELAVVLPAIILFAAGIANFALRLRADLALSESVRIAARTAASYAGGLSACEVAKRTFADAAAKAKLDPARFTLTIEEADIASSAPLASRGSLNVLRLSAVESARAAGFFSSVGLFQLGAASSFVIEGSKVVDGSCLS